MSSFSLMTRGLFVVALLALGLALAPATPVLAADCATIAPGADLQGCDLPGRDLSGVRLTGANLSGTNLRSTNLNGARLNGANLTNADLRGSTFAGADLRGANLSGATVYPGTLAAARTTGANLNVRSVPAPTAVPVNRLVTLSYTFAGTEGADTFCFPNVQVSGFQPTITYTVQFSFNGFYLSGSDGTVTTGSNGDGLLAAPFSIMANGASLEAQVDGVSSGARTITCPAP